MPMVWSIVSLFPVGAGMIPPEEVGVGEASRTGLPEVGIRTSPALRLGVAGAAGVNEGSFALEGGGMREEPSPLRGEGATLGTLGGAKSSVLLCSGELGGGGRKGVVSAAVDGSATMIAGTYPTEPPSSSTFT